ncbi:P-loop containing nucleoside triphosphate hydrolase protein [Mycena galopus ATCC 62051]|nr:P-loop containing nucleoside triphosphate hydrolase protein [Mycena galopus ATCC 62051]
MDQWTIAVLGEGGVGKTELGITFALNCIMPSEDPDPQFFRKQFVVDNHMCFVELLAHTASQLPREGIEAQGFLLVYSITSRSSFDRIEEFHRAAVRVKGANSLFILVGNKCDKLSEREVSREEGAALAGQLGCEFTETSAKTALNVERTLTHTARALRQKNAAESSATQDHSGKEKKKKKDCVTV